MSARRPFWRRVLLPVFLLLLGLNLLAMAAWTWPRSHRQRNAAARAESARAEVVRQREAVVALRERADAIEANAADLERFYGSLVGAEKTDLLPTLEAIEDLARAPGLRPGSRTLRRVDVDDARLERVAVTLPLEGSYGQLVGFLRGVERSPRFLTVERVSMRAGSDGGGVLQVELSAYLSRAAEAATGGARAR